jgi:hypothetical protein
MSKAAPTLQNLAASKLLNYVVKDQLKSFYGPEQYAKLEMSVIKDTGKPKPTINDIKKYISINKKMVDAIRKNQIGTIAFGKYLKAVQRLQNMDRGQATEVRQVMREPRRRYLGCLATKLGPDDYEGCLDSYDNPDYDNIKLVPSRLKQRVFENGDQATRSTLERSVTRPGVSFSDLPSGLKHYISSNPSEFKNYYEERRHEVGLMRSVLKNLSTKEKKQLREYYQTHKKMDSDSFRQILEGKTDQSSTRSKRARSNVKGGCGGKEEEKWWRPNWESLEDEYEDDTASLTSGISALLH